MKGNDGLAEASAIPVHVVGGFLGAGKTTFLNRLLRAQQHRRLAILVNDFGAIDIDGLLLERRDEDVLALRNGCICCSLQADLFSTLRMILSRRPMPEAIFIECSGVSKLQEMRRTLADPMLWQYAALEGVICVVSAVHVIAQARITEDPLWKEQILSSDMIVLSHMDEIGKADIRDVEERLQKIRGGIPILPVSENLLTHGVLVRPLEPTTEKSLFWAEGEDIDDDFINLEWRREASLDLMAFRSVIERHAPVLLRAKGILYLTTAPQRALLLQMTGSRITIGVAPEKALSDPASRLVFIGRSGMFDSQMLKNDLDAIPA
ncbi:CobW family GTP-binding protein [Gluconobacter morbifer]|uniref:Cobalamin biosynthesis protein CobW n=1 Tax=Gluconobacter morbifer G707 TaxID=1088869 RepID=G6XHF1_9PROT|nr:GTP-binding protein [Gluconobacter morbifer]EHH69609.1 cobalamin biosynthesis protein CobW [Gluconobacter morbifer G707]